VIRSTSTLIPLAVAVVGILVFIVLVASIIADYRQCRRACGDRVVKVCVDDGYDFIGPPIAVCGEADGGLTVERAGVER
jgi:hypothetical protein